MPERKKISVKRMRPASPIAGRSTWTSDGRTASPAPTATGRSAESAIASGRPGDQAAEPHELRRRAAERVLDLLRPQEVAVDRIVDVDRDAAVDVEARVADPAAGLRRPELRGRDL